MKKQFLLLAMAGALSSSIALGDDLLQGDTRLACEAIFCFSSNAARPSECNPSINKYFSITKKKASDTKNARRSFLQLCPQSQDENMPELVESILNGAGNCDADTLNAKLRKRVTVKVCTKPKNPIFPPECRNEQVWIVSSQLPAYCKAYATHGFTDITLPKYKGEPLTGGKWVN